MQDSRGGTPCLTSLILALLVLCCVALPVAASGDSGENNYYSPENVLRFAEHLYTTGDYLRAAGEYQRYLFLVPKEADSTLYQIGLCYRLAGDAEKAIGTFHKVVAGSTEARLRSTASYQIAYSHFLLNQYGKSIRYIDQALNDAENVDEQVQLQVLAAFGYLNQRRWQDAERTIRSSAAGDAELNNTASALINSAREGMSLPRKSPALAGLFSTVVPGAGKIYCKQYGDGIYSLILIGITGLLAWDGFRDDGARSARGWLFGGISGVFYAGNVYGSAAAARVYNRQLEVRLLKRLPTVPDIR